MFGVRVGKMGAAARGFYGPQLVTNGGFDTDTSGWDALGDAVLTWVSGGSMSVQRVTNSGDFARSVALSTEVGADYRVTADVVVAGASGARVAFTSNVGAGATGNVVEGTGAGSYEEILQADATTMYLQLGCRANGETNQYDNVFIQKIRGS